MVGGERLAFVCGAMCAVLGAVLIAFRDHVDGGVWFGPAILAGGLVLIVMAFLSARRQREAGLALDAGPPVQRVGSWFPASLLLIGVLQFTYLLWRKYFGGP